MLEIRPTCENCNKTLKPNSAEAMICSYECTFCSDCVIDVLYNVCPNCGGGFQQRPIRPKAKLIKDKPCTNVIYKPIRVNKLQNLIDTLKEIPPHKR